MYNVKGMTEQFKGIVEFKRTITFYINVILRYSGKTVKLNTKVLNCLLVPRQEVAVFEEDSQVSIITPDCGECPAAVKNGASKNRICHIYRSNLPYLKK